MVRHFVSNMTQERREQKVSFLVAGLVRVDKTTKQEQQEQPPPLQQALLVFLGITSSYQK